MLILGSFRSSAQDARFIIEADPDVNFGAVETVRKQLSLGLKVLRTLPIPLREDRWPVTVNLYPYNGVSNASGGQGPINLFGVGRRNSAIIHELTHVLTGYRGRGGDAHWVSEGFATYIQDEHGRPTFPTRGQAHGLARLIFDRGIGIPMTDLMKARRRTAYFGRRVDAWTRWRAYALSASLTRFLIERDGMQKFAGLYARRSDDDQEKAVAEIYGKPTAEIIGEWKRSIARQNLDMRAAERAFNLFARVFR